MGSGKKRPPSEFPHEEATRSAGDEDTLAAGVGQVRYGGTFPELEVARLTVDSARTRRAELLDALRAELDYLRRGFGRIEERLRELEFDNRRLKI